MNLLGKQGEPQAQHARLLRRVVQAHLPLPAGRRVFVQAGGQFPQRQKYGVWSRRAVVRSTLRWFSTTWSRTMLVFCAIATPCPRAPTSCNPLVRRFNVACTPTQPQLSSASHNSKNGRTGSRPGTRATSTTHPSCNMRGTSTSRANAIAAGARRATGPQRPFCQHCCQHVATATCLARHAAPHLAAPCCAWAARPLLRFVQDAAESKRSPGPPGRLRLRCVCVCVGGCVR